MHNIVVHLQPKLCWTMGHISC